MAQGWVCEKCGEFISVNATPVNGHRCTPALVTRVSGLERENAKLREERDILAAKQAGN